MGCVDANGPQTDVKKLIGKVPKVSLCLDDVPIQCILDTGSNVSLIKNSYFSKHFGSNGMKLKDASSWLVLEAANGLDIPYLGYVLLHVKIGQVELPECGFLVIKDQCLTDSEGVLGMNVISQCYEKMDQEKPLAYLSSSGAEQRAWTTAFQICASQARFAASDGSIGYVRTINRHPIQIPPRSEMLVWGRTKTGVDGRDYQCLVEPVEVGEVLIARTLSTVHDGRLLIRVQNLNDSPMYLYRHQKLAKTFIIDPADIIQENSVNMTRVGVNTVRVWTKRKPCPRRNACSLI